MTAKYRRADDNRWWPVHGRRARPMPRNEPVEVKLKDGEETSHAGLDWNGTVWLSGGRNIPIKAVTAWRYKLPPAIRWPGDVPGKWQPTDEEYDDGPEVEAAAA